MLKMPKEFEGKKIKKSLTKTTPRKWTLNEYKFMNDLKKKGFTISEIAERLDRSKDSVSLKLKRLSKKEYRYNPKHIHEKYSLNDRFMKIIGAKSVLDVYAGQKSYYENYTNIDLISNDVNKESKTTYHMDSLDLMCTMYLQRKKFDLIDLDPFGSASECLDLAMKMVKKGFVVTFGELGHTRWKRLDYVRRHYGIDNLKDFTVEKLIEHICKIGAKHKLELIPIFIGNWDRISRVYFMVKKMKITEQWDKK
jgi:N2,N2-dimethylguanosine tRNA methyltransferase